MEEKTVSSSFWIQSTEVVGSGLVSTFIWAHSQCKFLIQPNFPVLPISLSWNQVELLSQYITCAFRALCLCQLQLLLQEYLFPSSFSHPSLFICRSWSQEPLLMESYFSVSNNILSHRAISVGHLSTFLSERINIIWIKLEKVTSMTRKYKILSNFMKTCSRHSFINLFIPSLILLIF